MCAADELDAPHTVPSEASAALALAPGKAPEETAGFTSEMKLEGVADGVGLAGLPPLMMHSRPPIPEAQVPSYGQVTALVLANAGGAPRADKATHSPVLTH